MQEIVINEIQIIPIKPQNGLVSFSSVVINNQFYVGNIAIYTSPSSKSGFRLVFPQKKLASGQVVDVFHPINKGTEEQLSYAIIKKYVELMDNFHHVEVV